MNTLLCASVPGRMQTKNVNLAPLNNCVQETNVSTPCASIPLIVMWKPLYFLLIYFCFQCSITFKICMDSFKTFSNCCLRYNMYLFIMAHTYVSYYSNWIFSGVIGGWRLSGRDGITTFSLIQIFHTSFYSLSLHPVSQRCLVVTTLPNT